MKKNLKDLNSEERRTLQLLARGEMKSRLMTDILADMHICSIEHWDCTEYLNDLQRLLNDFGTMRTRYRTLQNTIARMIDDIETGGTVCSLELHIALRRLCNALEGEIAVSM